MTRRADSAEFVTVTRAEFFAAIASLGPDYDPMPCRFADGEWKVCRAAWPGPAAFAVGEVIGLSPNEGYDYARMRPIGSYRLHTRALALYRTRRDMPAGVRNVHN